MINLDSRNRRREILGALSSDRVKSVGPLAQRLELPTHNRNVTGSNPVGATKLPKLHIPRQIMDCAAKSERNNTPRKPIEEAQISRFYSRWQVGRGATCSQDVDSLPHQHTTKLARQGFILFTHMLVVSPVPKRDRNDPLRRVFSCSRCQLVLIWFGQLREDMS